MFLLAKIVKTKGNKGEVVVSFLETFSCCLEAGSRLTLERGGGRRQAEVESMRVVNGNVLVKFRGVDNMTDAYGLIGCSVYSDRNPGIDPHPEEVPGLSGWSLFDPDGRLVGTISEVLDRVIQPLLVVCDETGKEHLVPLVEEWIRSEDPQSGRIVMDLPRGLIGIN